MCVIIEKNIHLEPFWPFCMAQTLLPNSSMRSRYGLYFSPHSSLSWRGCSISFEMLKPTSFLNLHVYMNSWRISNNRSHSLNFRVQHHSSARCAWRLSPSGRTWTRTRGLHTASRPAARGSTSVVIAEYPCLARNVPLYLKYFILLDHPLAWYLQYLL